MNIKDIARRAGVSSATISRVINNSGYVKDETRYKVLEAIREYNYVPSAVARSLSTNDTLSIGAIIPDIENEFFSKVISGISEVAETYHYNIVFLGTNETLSTEHDFLRIVQSQRLKGVIITPISESDMDTRDYLIQLEESGIPVVLVDRDVKGGQFDGVFVDNVRGAYDGVTELIKAGHERIAIIAGPKTSKPGKDRLQGYMQAMEDHNLPVLPGYIACGDFKIAKAYECTKQLFELQESPTAIFTSNNLSTMGCLKYLTEHGIQIGEDLSLIGFDDIDALKMIDYRLSVIDRDAKQQGREAMELLIECFSSEHRASKRITIPYQIILRGSEKSRII